MTIMLVKMRNEHKKTRIEYECEYEWEVGGKQDGKVARWQGGKVARRQDGEGMVERTHPPHMDAYLLRTT